MSLLGKVTRMGDLRLELRCVRKVADGSAVLLEIHLCAHVRPRRCAEADRTGHMSVKALFWKIRASVAKPRTFPGQGKQGFPGQGKQGIT